MIIKIFSFFTTTTALRAAYYPFPWNGLWRQCGIQAKAKAYKPHHKGDQRGKHNFQWTVSFYLYICPSFSV